MSHAWVGWPPESVLQVLTTAILVTIAISTVQYVNTGVSRYRTARATP